MILNDENMIKDKKGDFNKYFEKVTSILLKIEANTTSLFDLFTTNSRHKDWFKQKKCSIIEPYDKSNCQNLRTLLKNLDYLEQINDEGVVLEDEHIKILGFYLIEWSNGEFKKIDYYNFSGGSLLLNWDKNENDNERKNY
jgi:hypothetical protein